MKAIFQKGDTLKHLIFTETTPQGNDVNRVCVRVSKNASSTVPNPNPKKYQLLSGGDINGNVIDISLVLDCVIHVDVSPKDCSLAEDTGEFYLGY